MHHIVACCRSCKCICSTEAAIKILVTAAALRGGDGKSKRNPGWADASTPELCPRERAHHEASSALRSGSSAACGAELCNHGKSPRKRWRCWDSRVSAVLISMAFPMEKCSSPATFTVPCWLQSKVAKPSLFTALRLLNRRQIKQQTRSKCLINTLPFLHASCLDRKM